MPQRWPLAKENAKVDIKVRQFLFGKKPNVFRVLFTIDGTATAPTVRVLRIRRAQRRFLSAKQINEAVQSGE